MLASDPHSATEDLLVLAHGFDSDMIAGVVRAGLAAAGLESMKAGGKTIEVSRIRITKAGTASDRRLKSASRRRQGCRYRSSLIPQGARPRREMPRQKRH